PADWGPWESDPMWGMVLAPGASPAAVSAAGTLDLFARAADGALVHMAQSGGFWTWWEALGADATTAPVLSRTSRGAQVLVRASPGAITNMSCPGGVLP